MVDDIWLTSAGGLLMRWLHHGEQGAIACRCALPHTYLFFIRIHEEVSYKQDLSVVVNGCCRQLDDDSISEDNVTPHIDLHCIDFLFDNARFTVWSQYWKTNSDFKTRARQTHGDRAVRALNEWRYTEAVIVRRSNWSFMYVGVVAFEWAAYKAHCCHGVPRPPALLHYSNLVPRSCSAQRHLIRVV